jgi:LCP family protein required for cell wall assembly
VNRIIARFRRLPVRLLAAVGAVGLVVVAVVAAMLIGRPSEPVVAIASPSPTATLRPTPTPTSSPTPTASPLPTASPSLAPDPVLGTDGRLTILLLGSDYRASHAGTRTTGAVAAASIPRDTVNFPTSSKATYRAKVNGLYQSLIGRMGQPQAAREMKRIIGDGIGVEVDSYAVIGFEGVRQLVNAVGGLDVTLARAVNDPYYWVTSQKQGVYFPAGRNHLNGDRALIFARTRKGDNDFERARRQQLLIGAAVVAVRERGLGNLPKLLAIAERFVRTDLPLRSAPKLFELVATANVGDAERIVFGPTKWATGGAGSSFTLKLDVVRAWTAEWMAPVSG